MVESTRSRSSRLTLLAWFVIVALGAAVYARSLRVPFIYDDVQSIQTNASIRKLWPITVPLSPPNDLPTSSRPLVNLSFAVNFALHGERVAGYHAVNLALHLMAAGLLLGVLRRSAERARPDLHPRAALAFAAAVTLLWTLHPLNTETVAYITQRTELMGSVFYLLTLYLAIRGWDAAGARGRWFALAVLACLAGMASKETVVSAPLFVLLYDRTLVSGSFKGALRKSPWLYAGMAATWPLLIFLVLWNPRSQSAGFGLNVSSLEYLQTQAGVIVWYLWLCFRPHPLAIAHNWPIERSLLAALPEAIFVLSLFVATLVFIVRKSWLGLAGAWFFMILAPSSSVVPIVTEVVAERRMYLPLAAVMCVAAAGVLALLRLAAPRRALTPTASAAVVALSLVAATVSAARLNDYRTHLSIWLDAAAKSPGNVAFHNIGVLLNESGRSEEALSYFAKVREDGAASWRTYLAQAETLMQLERWDEAKAALEAASRIKPDAPAVPSAMGSFYLIRKDYAAAEREFRRAIDIDPQHAQAYNGLGAVLFAQGRLDEAEKEIRTALDLLPQNAVALNNLGNVEQARKRADEAAKLYREALRLRPHLAEANHNLARILIDRQRFDEAVPLLITYLKQKPNDAAARVQLGSVLAQLGRIDEARPHILETLDYAPTDAAQLNQLGNARASVGEVERAIETYREAIRLKPDYAEAYNNLGATLAGLGRWDEAIEQYRAAVKLDPKLAGSWVNLGTALTAGGQIDEAEKAFAEAVRADPKNFGAANALALHYLSRGRLADAEVYFRKAVEIDPSNPRARNDLGSTLGRQGKFDDAAEQFIEALRLKPDFADAQSNLDKALAGAPKKK